MKAEIMISGAEEPCKEADNEKQRLGNSGDHIDIVLRKNGKEQIIKLHSISKYHGVFRFSYTRTGDFMYCKIRTWENRSGKKRFSE